MSNRGGVRQAAAYIKREDDALHSREEREEVTGASKVRRSAGSTVHSVAEIVFFVYLTRFGGSVVFFFSSFFCSMY